MLNGIINSDNINNNGVNKDNNIVQISDAQRKYSTSPFNKNNFIDEMCISTEAISLYEKEQDIAKFSTLALSDENDASHLDIINSLFERGVKDPFGDDILASLAANQRLLDDLNG